MLSIVLFFIIICCIIYFWVRKYGLYNHLYQNLPPMYPGLKPILGHSLMLINSGDKSHLWKLVQECSKIITQNGGVMTASIAGSLHFVLTDPDDCTTIGNECPDKNYVYEFTKPWLGCGLLTGNGDTWKRHRKLLNPAFNQQVINSFIDIFNTQAKQLVIDLEVEVGKGPFNHISYLENTTLETVYQTALGIKPENENVINKQEFLNTIKQMFNIVTMRFSKFWLQNEFIYKWSGVKRMQDDSLKVMTETYYHVVQIKKATNKISGPRSGTKMAFLDLILELSADGLLSNEEVWEEVNTIMVNSNETSATNLTFLLILLGSHPDVQDKAYNELKEIFGATARDVDKTDLTKLVYLEAVIMESLRIYPISPVILRRVTHDVKLKNYTLPADTNCVLLVYGLHRHPVWGEDADQFRPERWLESPQPPRNGFSGFGLGKRHCVGKQYAVMFIKTILANVLRRYRITADESSLKLQLDVFLKPYSGHLISIEKRVA